LSNAASLSVFAVAQALSDTSKAIQARPLISERYDIIGRPLGKVKVYCGGAKTDQILQAIALDQHAADLVTPFDT
jgi:hypothetical protein